MVSKKEEEEKAQQSPEVVDLEARKPPPFIVDLSETDQAEKRELLTSFFNMFPDTPQEYLEEQAEELAGKPAATERFIVEHLARNCKPPEYWVPGQRAAAATEAVKPRNQQQQEEAATLAHQQKEQTALPSLIPQPTEFVEVVEANESGRGKLGMLGIVLHKWCRRG